MEILVQMLLQSLEGMIYTYIMRLIFLVLKFFGA